MDLPHRQEGFTIDIYNSACHKCDFFNNVIGAISSHAASVAPIEDNNNSFLNYHISVKTRHYDDPFHFLEPRGPKYLNPSLQWDKKYRGG